MKNLGAGLRFAVAAASLKCTAAVPVAFPVDPGSGGLARRRERP